MQITENCIVNGMPEKIYHGDPCVSPSLSSSMVITIMEATEEDCFLQSKRLNPAYKEDATSAAADLGTIAHDYVLRGGKDTYEIAPFDSWRRDDAKLAKADIERRGLVALNTSHQDMLDDVKRMADKLHNYLATQHDYPGLMMNGKAEQSGFALKNGIWKRARFDWLDHKYPDLIVDYKTTGVSFENWQKNQLWTEGKWMQSVHYRDVYASITGREPNLLYVVQQVKEPFHVQVITTDASYTDDMLDRYNSGCNRFKKCLETGIWRGERPYTIHSCPPPWVLSRWEEEAGDIRP